MEAQELKDIIQESVRETIREVLKEERLALCLALIPRVSEKEMQAIKKQFGSPSDYDKDDFVNMTDWVRHGTNIQ
ncbi:hypothetical protein [Argonema galeatum]|uniref:hypothetical protein n=1 Tax=Argonema galeatum TaxID=2942762 RepID=UPI0020133ED3|nr:hypothetical protein [Argonema galeatum]MCL1467838.1 hypothetical protein [Argonema galeatum A003/A1]